jgi:hypothetical protein
MYLFTRSTIIYLYDYYCILIIYYYFILAHTLYYIAPRRDNSAAGLTHPAASAFFTHPCFKKHASFTSFFRVFL